MRRFQRRKGKKRKWGRLRLFCLLFLLCALGLVALTDIRIRPMIKTYGVNQATTTATQAVNTAAQRVLDEMGLQYADLTSVTKDAEGNILSVSTNTANVNRLKSAVGEAVLEELEKQDYQMVKIPLGSIWGGGLLTGRGPKIPVKVPMNSTVTVTFDNTFDSAGINQTRHEITLNVKVTVYAMLPGDSTAVEVETGFTAAETILVGEVPDWAAITRS
ncbi:MAG TPA: sporulation protein YunB [Firmicutes bacterium]|nr:sporulation protein YunB [Bacillota bacterium]